MVLQLMPKLNEPFSGFDVGFKSAVEKLIYICYLLPRKTTESMGYDFVQSYE